MFERELPFFAVRVYFITEFQKHMEMGDLMNIGDQEQIGVQVFIQGNAGVTDMPATGEIAYFGLTATGEYQVKGVILPEGKTIRTREPRNVLLKDLTDLF